MKLEIVEARYTVIEVDDKYAELCVNYPNYLCTNDNLWDELCEDLREKGYKFHEDDEVKDEEIAIAEMYSEADNDAIMK